MDITKIQSAGYNITYIAQPGEHGPRVLVDWRSLINPVGSYIVNTYGQAVFDAANAWLNQQANAQVLATFINGDPDMVCSLGLQVPGVTLPTRYIIGDGASWIESGMLVTKYIGVSVNVEHLATSNCSMMYTQSDIGSSNRYGMSLYGGTGVVLNYNGTYHIISNCTNTTQPHQYEFNKDAGKFKVDGVQKDSWTWNVEPSAYVGIFASHVGLEIMKAKTGSWIFYDNRTGDEVTRYIPYKHPTQGNGMLDLVNGVFYANAGSGAFTITEE